MSTPRMTDNAQPHVAAHHRRIIGGRRGFTLVEVLVSVAIISILLVIISRVLSDVRAGISVAMADMEIANYASAIENRLRDDIRRMDTNAFLVIKNQILFVDYPEPAVPPAIGAKNNRIDPTWFYGNTPDMLPRPSEIFGGDQLLFFANGPFKSQRYGLHTSSGGAANDARSLVAPQARIWWGHLSPDTFGSPPFGTDRDIPILPFKWRLGRHALLIAPNWVAYETPGGQTDIVASYSPWSTEAVFKAPPASYDLNTAATMLDYRGLFLGDSDVVTGMTMDDIRSVVRENRIGTTFITADTLQAGNNPPVQRAPALGWMNSRRLPGGAAPSQFNLGTAFVPPYTMIALLYQPLQWNTTMGTSPGERDRMVAAVFRPFADPEPDIFTGNENDKLMTAESIIAPHCSSITIEFAGDYTTSATGIPTNLPGTFRTADGVIDRKRVNPADPNGPAIPDGPEDGEIYWYGGVELDIAPTHGFYSRRRGVNSNIYWNETYRFIDQYVGGASPEIAPFAGYSAAFGYDKVNTPWPKMLRITVTLQDQRGRLYDRYLNSNGQEPQGRTSVFIVNLPE